MLIMPKINEQKKKNMFLDFFKNNLSINNKAVSEVVIHLKSSDANNFVFILKKKKLFE